MEMKRLINYWITHYILKPLLKHLFGYDFVEIKGRGRLRAIDPQTGLQVYCSPWTDNLILTCGKELICRMLIDEAGYDTGLTWTAIGTDNTAPILSDTTLGTEVKRLAITHKARTGNKINLSTFFSKANSSYAIEEAGEFGHDASSAPDSGTPLTHFLVSYDNSSGLVDIIIDYEVEIG